MGEGKIGCEGRFSFMIKSVMLLCFSGLDVTWVSEEGPGLGSGALSGNIRHRMLINLSYMYQQQKIATRIYYVTSLEQVEIHK